MSSESMIVIHIGAPRTGTSFLRKEVFPKLKNFHFTNKQLSKNDVTEFFDSLSHYGDGDELSVSLGGVHPLELTKDKKKILVSEEHLLWSVYHLFGNVGSRALLLKRYFPHAKIILSIRRQPEFLMSTYFYLKSLKKPKTQTYLKSIWNFVNFTPNINHIKIKKIIGIPSGIEWSESDSTYDIGLNYFRREARHFIAADFSWLSLYKIYSELFGAENILVIPQEIWSDNPARGILMLEDFTGEKISSEDINFNNKVNTVRSRTKISAPQRQRFINYIQSLVWEDNEKLNHLLQYCDLDSLGYTKQGVILERYISLGWGNSRIDVGDKFGKVFKQFRRDSFRKGVFSASINIMQKISHLLFSIQKLKQQCYRFKRMVADNYKGLDFEKIESVKDLSLDPRYSEQYESSKIDELEELFRKVELPERIRFMDLGSGKGRVVCYMSEFKKVEISRGIEISLRLCRIAQKNISILRCRNCEVLNMDVRQIPKRLIEDTNVFYFYNPFTHAVFLKTLEFIYDSLDKRESGIVIIYFNPVYGDVIEEVFANRFYSINYENKISKAITSVYWIS